MMPRLPDAPFPIEIHNEIALVRLKNGGFAVIDAADAEFVGRWAWVWKENRPGHPYVQRGRVAEDEPGSARILLHRELMNPPPGKIVDHEDGNGLDCRRGNMRICTHPQNLKNKRRVSRNRAGFKGVIPSRTGRRFRAQIMSDGVTYRLGTFGTAEEAHAAYVAAANRLHGEFANAG